MTYEVIQDRREASVWRAEAIDHEGDGDCYVVIFSGPDAQARAECYAAWMNQAVPVVSNCVRV